MVWAGEQFYQRRFAPTGIKDISGLCGLIALIDMFGVLIGLYCSTENAGDSDSFLFKFICCIKSRINGI